jgi:hypothetical protein
VIYVKERNLEGKLPFYIDVKGERLIKCMERKDIGMILRGEMVTWGA